MAKIEIDLDKFKDDNGNYPGYLRDVIERGSGKTFPAALATSDIEFTSEEIGKMSVEEYAEKQPAIMDALKRGKVK